jgi:hypothetical protein
MFLGKVDPPWRGTVLHLIKRHPAAGSFSPEDITVLAAAFDEAWEHLEKSGARLESERRVQEARNILGKCIIDEALKGERDPHRLRETALLLGTCANESGNSCGASATAVSFFDSAQRSRLKTGHS